jgi:DNA polymerase-3 subunit delta
MKYQHRALPTLAKKFPEGVFAILVYGPDAGHVSETVKKLVGGAVTDPKDPFSITEIDAQTIKQDPAFVVDSALAFSMSGDRRLIRIRNATDIITPVIETILQFETIEANIILDAGNLDRRSKLRTLFESDKKLGSLACFGDQGSSLKNLINKVFKESDIHAGEGVLDYLFARLGSDRQHTVNELNKLTLMVGPGAHLSLEETIDSIGDAGLLALEDIAYFTGSANLDSLCLSLQRAEDSGQSPIAILRTVINHFQRLHSITIKTEDGAPLETTIKSLRPPVFWRRQQEFERQAQTWTSEKLEMALERFFVGEHQCKTTGIPQMPLCCQVLIGVCLIRPYNKLQKSGS